MIRMGCRAGQYRDDFGDCYSCEPICQAGNLVWELRHCKKDCPDEYAKLHTKTTRAILSLFSDTSSTIHSDWVTSTQSPNAERVQTQQGHLVIPMSVVAGIMGVILVCAAVVGVVLIWKRSKRKDVAQTQQQQNGTEMEHLNPNHVEVQDAPPATTCTSCCNGHKTCMSVSTGHGLHHKVKPSPTKSNGRANTMKRDDIVVLEMVDNQAETPSDETTSQLETFANGHQSTSNSYSLDLALTHSNQGTRTKQGRPLASNTMDNSTPYHNKLPASEASTQTDSVCRINNDSGGNKHESIQLSCEESAHAMGNVSA